MRKLAVLALGFVSAVALMPHLKAAGTGYHILNEIKIGGEGGWDYLTVDSASSRLYVSHATHVVVVDLASGKVVGDIPDTPGVHGIALAPELGKGFISNGRGNNITIFDMKTLKATGTVAAEMNPDDICYDRGSQRVFAFNGRSRSATVVDAKSGMVAATIPLPGKPEFSVADGKGHVYTNIEDMNQIVEIDAAKAVVAKKYALTGCEGPSGMAMDLKARRIFSVCGNRVMAVSDPDKGAVITARMLAGHLAGIRHYKDGEVDSQKHYDTVLGGLERFQNDPLVVAPGTKFSYSSYGYNLLSAAIEAASGEPFLDTEQKLVFTPLGLLRTTADQPAQIIEQRARFYSGAKGKPKENAPYVDNSYKWAGGGFLSTTEDLVRFGSAFLKPGFLKADSLALLFTPQKTKDGSETRYGMGWFIGKSESGQKIYEHSGGSVGGSSELIVYPDAHLVVAFICNYSGDADGWKGEEVQRLGEAFQKH